jgi:ATP-dependent DNA helicase Q1
LQLEKIIGKLKTERYGSRILEQVEKYSDAVQTDELNEEQGSQNRATKRLKSKKALVVIESSDDEA